MNTMQEWIGKAAAGQDLQIHEAAAAMRCIMSGQATDAQIAALIMALRMKGETAGEISAFAAVMRERAAKVPIQGDDLFDLCGTGGDGTGTINVSTLAALVVASLGVRVAKHGNRSVSSSCGSADLLEALGVNLDAEGDALVRCLDDAGICFLFAPKLHPAMAHAAGPRREMGVRTVFNLLGPLTNPAHVQRQLLGVFDAAWTTRMAEVLQRLGAVQAMVVHGEGGMDEVSLAGPTQVSELKDGRIRRYEIQPEDFGLTPAPLEAVRGGDVDENVRLARAILQGEPGPGADLVALNAGAALQAAGKADSIADGVAEARKALSSGAAHATLEKLREAGRS
jgi:anthranilate phosphoribosyltransferase